MKDAFDKVAVETEASRQQAQRERQHHLEQRAQAIEDRLRSPRPPAPALKPKGALRELGDSEGRKAEQQQYVDIKTELDRIKQEREQQKEKQRQNAINGKSL